MPHSAVVYLEDRVRARLLDAPLPAPIIAPGINCWRVPLAHRAAMLADAAAYFRHLDDALIAATLART